MHFVFAVETFAGTDFLLFLKTFFTIRGNLTYRSILAKYMIISYFFRTMSLTVQIIISFM
jgi:hypothetical protein